MIKSWLFDLPVRDPGGAFPLPGDSVYEHIFRLWERVEELGFEGIFLSEHHWPISLAPSPNLMLAVLAVRTRRIRIGQLALTAALYHPGRIAEEIGMLDQMSGGRLEIGIARGAGPYEVEQFGIPADEMRPRLEETLDIVEGLLTATEPFNYEGRHYRCRNLVVSPKPLQQPLPPIWLPAITADSSRMAARRGYKVCAGFRSVPWIADMFDAYREAAAEAGRPAGPEQLAIRRVVLCRHDEVAARRLGRDVAEQFARFESLAEIVTDDDIIAGTPDQVTAQVLEQCSRTGAGHIVLFGSGHMPHADWAEMIDLFGLEVLPRLRESAVGASTAQLAEA